MAAKLTRVDTTAPSGRKLYHLQLSLQAASPETFGYTLEHGMRTSVEHNVRILLRELGTSSLIGSRYSCLVYDVTAIV
jgi:hypothetical protein